MGQNIAASGVAAVEVSGLLIDRRTVTRGPEADQLISFCDAQIDFLRRLGTRRVFHGHLKLPTLNLQHMRYYLQGAVISSAATLPGPSLVSWHKHI
jgi:hypothetical protein